MKKSLLFSSVLFVGASSFAQTHSDTLFYTGSEQTWTVPCGAQNISIITYGAQGAAGSTITPGTNVGGPGGLGNKVVGAWSFAEGDQLFIYVGGQATGMTGGFNGGGNGVAIQPNYPSGGGGGATDVRFPTNALNHRIQVSGGGGGGGNAGSHGFGSTITGGDGGHGGGNQLLFGNSLNGQNGADCADGTDVSPGATGGTELAAGIQGNGCSGFLGDPGFSFSLNVGGNGGPGESGFGVMAPSGGAGGGGYTGGNGGGGGSAGTSGCSGNSFGAGGGGSAGTNYFDGPVAGENGVWSGNGMVVINYDVITESALIDTSFITPCVGQTVTFSASPSNGTFSLLTAQSGDLINADLSPSQLGTYEIQYSSTQCGITTTDIVTLTVNCDVAGIETNEMAFSIYPNPANESISIKAEAKISQVIIIDIYGKIVKEISDNFDQQISVMDLTPGLYFVKILNQNKQVSNVQNLIVE